MSNAETTRITATEAAELLGISKDTLYRWAEEGKIPAGKIERNWIFIREDIESRMRKKSS